LTFECLARRRSRYPLDVKREQGRVALRVVRPASAGAAPAPLTLPLDDAELVAAIQTGDTDAAETLHNRLRPKIEATVRRLLGAGDVDQDDCVQIAFLEIVRSIDRYRGECPIDHWAAQIAANVVYKHIRRRRLERRVFDGRGPLRPSERPEPISSSRRLVAKDLVEHVRRKLDAIDPAKAFAFLLHDVLGFDLREIAEITDVSVAAAQKRLVRGRRDIHAQIARDPELAALVSDLGEEP
jgi:RNA polymerase sigma-70 factor (ECF subfamily)